MRNATILHSDTIETQFGICLGGLFLVELVKRSMRAPELARTYLSRLTGPTLLHMRKRHRSRMSWLRRIFRPVSPACSAAMTRS